jgi:hypothetical protein
MADCVDAAMNSVKSPGKHPPTDRVLADPNPPQLRGRNHPVLPARKQGDLGIGIGAFPVHFTGKSPCPTVRPRVGTLAS